MIEIPPPIKPAKSTGKKWYKALEIKCPNKDEGRMIKAYLRRSKVTGNSKFGTAFFIFLKFNNAVTMLDKKYEIIIAFTPTKNVSPTKDTSNTIAPIM